MQRIYLLLVIRYVGERIIAAELNEFAWVTWRMYMHIFHMLYHIIVSKQPRFSDLKSYSSDEIGIKYFSIG